MLMSCQIIQERMSRYLDDRLAAPERRSVDLHLAACGECATRRDQMAGLRVNLRSLPIIRAPERLATDLHLLASQELMRFRRKSSRSVAMQFWRDRASLLIDNLMKPLALPFVGGGLTSAVFIFGMLMPHLGLLRSAANDNPVTLYTEPIFLKIPPLPADN